MWELKNNRIKHTSTGNKKSTAQRNKEASSEITDRSTERAWRKQPSKRKPERTSKRTNAIHHAKTNRHINHQKTTGPRAHPGLEGHLRGRRKGRCQFKL